LQAKEVPIGLTPKVKDHVVHKAKWFKWEGHSFLRMWANGQVKVVPCLEQCEILMRHVHEELGHFGVGRTHSLLQTQYWWRGMQLQIQQFVSRCMMCDQVQASTPTPHLRSLPIMGLGYIWSLDFAGTLRLTLR
jgi:hypothetical protein